MIEAQRFQPLEPSEGLASLVTRLAHRLCAYHADIAAPWAGSGLSAWIALAALARAADGATRREIEAAIGTPGDRGLESANVVLTWLADHPGISVAAALWVKEDVPIESTFASELGAVGGGSTPSQAECDRWVKDATDGAIERMPVDVSAADAVLAAAIVSAGSWTKEFEAPFTEGDPVTRSTQLDDSVSIVRHNGLDFSRVVVTSDTHVDVHLFAGAAEVPPAVVFDAMFAAALGGADHLPGPELRAGDEAGCLRVTEEAAESDEEWVRLSVFPFDLRHRIDLLDPAAPVGLVDASDPNAADLSRLSSEPVVVSAAVQESTFVFGEKGFQASAATAMTIDATGLPIEPAKPHRVRVVRAAHNRPHAVAVVDRASGMVLLHGWVVPESSSRRR